MADVLLAASRHWPIELHFQKGLAGAPEDVRAAALSTPVNPAVVDAFALAIIASEGPPAFPGLLGHEPNVADARHDAARIKQATSVLRAAAPNGGGAYVAESNYFQSDWQAAYWGANYPRLRRSSSATTPPAFSSCATGSAARTGATMDLLVPASMVCPEMLQASSQSASAASRGGWIPARTFALRPGRSISPGSTPTRRRPTIRLGLFGRISTGHSPSRPSAAIRHSGRNCQHRYVQRRARNCKFKGDAPGQKRCQRRESPRDVTDD